MRRWAGGAAAVVVSGAVLVGVAQAGAAAPPAPLGSFRSVPMMHVPSPAPTAGATAASSAVKLSTNWSGYAVTSPSKFTSVQGDFVQPAVTCTGKGQYVAAWVGLDGYNNSTVEQDGTFATCIGPHNDTPVYVAWYEMYPAGSVELFPVNAGDEIAPAVTYTGTTFTLSLTDVTTGQSGSFTAPCKSCRRASAEWIVERPELCNTRQTKCFLSALPDFGAASATDGTAGTVAAPAGPISSFTDIPIDMIQPQGTSVELLDQTNPLDATGSDFSVTWERAGRRLPVS
jgi:hypothetical protein